LHPYRTQDPGGSGTGLGAIHIGINIEIDCLENGMEKSDIKEKNGSSSFNLIVGIHKAKIPEASKPKCYRIKVLKMGDIFEIYKYEYPIYAGYHKFKTSKIENEDKDVDKDIKIENRKKVVTRSRNNVRRLAIANFNEYSKFFTATFADNISDMDFANGQFKKFIKRLKYKYGDFKYLAVVEFQKRGSIHYHMITNFGFIKQKDLEKIWGNGFVWIKNLLKAKNGKQVDNVGAYLVKYMSKESIDERLMGKKSYLTSRNLIRPETIYEDMSLKECFDKYNLYGSHLIYANNFISKENGKVEYYEINKKRIGMFDVTENSFNNI